VTPTGTITNVGSTPNTFTVTITNKETGVVIPTSALAYYETLLGTLTVTKAPLTITAGNQTITAGRIFAPWTVSYNGLVPGENANALNGTLAFRTNANANAAGTYYLEAYGLTSANYDITYVNGELNVGLLQTLDVPPTPPVTPPVTPPTPPFVAAGGTGIPAATEATEADPVETITPVQTPTTVPEKKIADKEPPLNAPDQSWALLNLLLTILTGILMLALLVTYILAKRREEDDESEYEVKKHGLIRLLSVAATIVSIVLFILTENMSFPMDMMDKYTIWHGVIAVATILITVLSRTKTEETAKQGK
jgi:hypothetical protein